MQINTINKFQNLTMRGTFQKNEELENVLKYAKQEELQRFKNNLERMAKVDDKKVYKIEKFDDWYSPDEESYRMTNVDYKFYENDLETAQSKLSDIIELSNADSKLALINDRLEKLYPLNKDTEQTENLKTNILNLLV